MLEQLPAHGGKRDVGNDAGPHGVRARARRERRVQRRRRRDVGVHPEVHAHAGALHPGEERVGIGEARPVPDERPGIRRALPSGLEAEHVERIAARRELRDLVGGLLCGEQRRHAVEEAESPLRREHASARIQVVATDRVERRRSGEHIDRRAGGGNEHLDGVGRRLRRPSPVEIAVAHDGRMLRVAPHRGTGVHGDVAGRVDQDAIAGARHVERHGGVGATVIRAAVVIDVQLLDAAALLQRAKVQAQPIELFARAEREAKHELAVHAFARGSRSERVEMARSPTRVRPSTLGPSRQRFRAARPAQGSPPKRARRRARPLPR